MARKVQDAQVALPGQRDARVEVVERGLRVDKALPPAAGIHDDAHHLLALRVHVDLVVVDPFGEKGVDPLRLVSSDRTLLFRLHACTLGFPQLRCSI